MCCKIKNLMNYRWVNWWVHQQKGDHDGASLSLDLMKFKNEYTAIPQLPRLFLCVRIIQTSLRFNISGQIYYIYSLFKVPQLPFCHLRRGMTGPSKIFPLGS